MWQLAQRHHLGMNLGLAFHLELEFMTAAVFKETKLQTQHRGVARRWSFVCLALLIELYIAFRFILIATPRGVN